MGFDLGAGLSAMGGSIASTAGQMATEMQRSNLEQERDKLLSDLTAKREEAGDTRRFQQAKDMIPLQTQAKLDEYKGQKNIDITNLPAVAKAQDTIAEMRASDPDWVKNQRIITDASATVEQRSAAALHQAQLVGVQIGNAVEKEKADATKDLRDALASNDTDKISAAKQRVAVANYSADTDVRNATIADTIVKANQATVTDIDTRMARISSSTQAGSSANKALLSQLQTQRDLAQQELDQSKSALVSASKKIVSLSGSPSGAQPLKTILFGGINETAPAAADANNLGTILGVK